MSPAVRLIPHRAAILDQIERMALPAAVRADLAALVSTRMAAAAKHAKLARERTEERKARIEAGIRSAAARVSPRVEVTAAIATVTRKLECAPHDFGLHATPCARVISRVVRAEWKKKGLSIS